MQRLNKYIASSGICSRRKADEYIENGIVAVNGKVISELGYKVAVKDVVTVNGKIIKPLKYSYYRFYKPAGYITTSDDEKGRRTIYDIIPKELHQLKPIGRLDKDSSGLIIMTNDGDLINEMAHPSIKIPKIYLVTVNGKVTPEDGEKMYNGFEIETDTGELKFAQAEVFPIDITGKSSTIQVTLYQGLNRQIRKMFAKLGFEVVTLKRIQHATITLEGLKKGEIKLMKPKQVSELKSFIIKAKRKADD
ncbi:MAG: rRNA pseudouridine synthase [bacterium]|nr:rRNA pseudouridine synthase [bacterium]